jgi:hypothetical protein
LPAIPAPPVDTPDGISASKDSENRAMDEARTDQAPPETKSPEKHSAPASGDSKTDSPAAAGAAQKGAKQDASTDAAEAFSKPPAGDSGKQAASMSNGEPDGQSAEQPKAGGGEEPALDANTLKLVDTRIDARVKSMLGSALEPLLDVNRKLARLLSEQIEIAIGLRQSVVAMERLMDADARRKGKYAAMRQQVSSEGDGMADPHWINRTRGVLGQIERTGTAGPKVEGETGNG